MVENKIDNISNVQYLNVICNKSNKSNLNKKFISNNENINKKIINTPHSNDTLSSCTGLTRYVLYFIHKL
jgi:hypothetical protein